MNGPRNENGSTMKIPSVTWNCAIAELAANEAATSGLPMDHDEFAAFHQRTFRPLRAYLARVSGDSALADDLLQEAYLRFLGAKVPDGGVACRRYLFRIASNLLRDHWRKRRPFVPLDELPESQDYARFDHSDRMDAETVLAPAFSRMRPRERQLLWLAYAEGATHREISEVTGLRETSIRLLLFRARGKLAGLLRKNVSASVRS